MTQLRSVNDIPLVTLPDDYMTNMGPFLAQMYEQHGPIFRANLFFGDIIYMVGPEANRFILSTNRQLFSHHEGWGKMFGVSDIFGNGLLTMDGAEHDQHRRMMNPAFTISYMDSYLPIMNRIIRERIATWADAGEIDIYEEARKITFDVAAEALAGLRVGPEVDLFREIFVNMLNLGMVAESEEDYERRMAQLKHQLRELLIPKIQERRAHPTSDVLGKLVQARDEQGNALSDEQLIAHTNILLVAGHETSTSLSAWLLYLLTQHPDYMKRVMDEQWAMFKGNEEPTLDDTKQMKVLENALSEAERMYPPVANGPRGVVQDFEFHGYSIPAGTHVFYSIVASHVIPSIFHNPTEFAPDRFAAPREEHKKNPYALVGFGGGPRICIGVNFAKVEIKAMVSQILRHYDMILVLDQQIIQFYRGTGLPLHGIKMRVHEKQLVH